MRRVVGVIGLLSLIVVSLVVFWWRGSEVVQALDPVEEIGQQIAELAHLRELSEAATAPLEEELEDLESKIAGIEGQLTEADNETERLAEDIAGREDALADQYQLLAVRVRSFYKLSRQTSPLMLFLASSSASDLARQILYRASLADEDKNVIVAVVTDLLGLEADRQALEERKVTLSGLRAQFEKEAAFFAGEIAGARDYQADLTAQIAALSAQQQAILNARSGTFTSSVGSVPVSSIPCSGPPGSPVYCNPGGGYFGAFSFGAWTHRKGMSQYGAKGRAEAGQGVNDILAAYYERTPVGKDTGGDIVVDGFGSMNFEDRYLLGIAEMPSSWPMEALKAQAIAARTYAYSYKSGGQSICATESCQVYSASKADNPPAEWRQAVQETRGQVLEGVTAFYSSTAGSYLTYPRGFWDTTDGAGGTGFSDRAWESKAGSPWFYSSWYTQSYSASSATCGRSNPWLSQEEMADILNARLVLDHGSDERILPVTINECPLGGSGGNPYSIAELRDKANGLGGAYTSVSSVSVSYGTDGQTASVTFTTNKGTVTMGGAAFKEAFNLRAPGYIAILSSLFNVEKT